MDNEKPPPDYPNDEPEYDADPVNEQEPDTQPDPVPVPVPVPIMSGIFDKFKSTSSSIRNSPILESTKKKVEDIAKNYGATIIIGIVIAIVLFILAYLLYIYISAKITNKIIVEVPTSSVPRKGNVISKMDGKVLPAANNGKRATFMFWIYLTDINLYSGDELRHIIHIGDKTTKGASPIVYLDGMKNRIYVRFSKDTDKVGPSHLPFSEAGTNNSLPAAYETAGQTDLADQIVRIQNYPHNSTAAQGTGKNHSPDNEYFKILGTHVPVRTSKGLGLGKLDAIRVDLATHGVIIEYVPLQRWVHIAVVVNETIDKGVITTYVDGEVVDTISSKDKVVLSTGLSIPVNFTGLNITKTGDVYTGGDVNDDDLSQGFPGIIGKINVSNFDMNGKEVYNMYIKGPIDNLASKLGLPAYAVRSPIYKIA
jgi:hypothetical protein